MASWSIPRERDRQPDCDALESAEHGALRSWRGRHGFGSTSTSTDPVDDTPSKPKPRKRQSLCTRGSRTRPPRPVTRTASQTSSQAAVRFTPCSTSSRLKASLSSPITTIGGSSPRSATRSQPQTSPLTVKPSAFEIALHRRVKCRLRSFQSGVSGLRGIRQNCRALVNGELSVPTSRCAYAADCRPTTTSALHSPTENRDA